MSGSHNHHFSFLVILGLFNAGFEFIIKRSEKIVKVVGEHPKWLGVTSHNFETFTPSIPLNLYA